MKIPYRRATVQLAFLVGFMATYGNLAAQTEPTVGVREVAIADVSPKHEFVGRVEAVDAVDVRARIEGFIQSRLFAEGQVVRKDQDLFLIDKRASEIALADAKAGLASAQATLADARRRLERNQSLSSQTVSRATLEESQAASENAAANVLSAQARVEQAELNLSFTRVSSPLDGRIGAAALSVGSFVNASSPALARVVAIDPIRVVFSVSDRSILELRAAAGGIGKDELAKRFAPGLRLSNGQNYEQAGEIEFFGNEIDEQTGTLAIRTLFPNPQALLIPGQFVTVVISEVEQKLRPVVPLGVVQQDREGKYVLLVNEQSEAVVRRIKVSEQSEGSWIVEDGLKGGETLIVEGLQNVSEGSRVKATPASEAAGVAGASAIAPVRPSSLP
ncbi:efflux RND transporter periplasmic adaptor subunit [Rhizobium sp. Root1220]|uniref:efflux RND transporter periplasmic adaptor subunit n=1 Tax=Rhizobium sp. Root1220 TaxID=1736432 RepID=UPI0006FF5480|nr:efflux RND transporter periplasmic adaptor subunit [Rhizobium sp. Root1220]KQV80003.1 hemolysin secretion protein D [Rhizobium sp. Root1220]